MTNDIERFRKRTIGFMLCLIAIVLAIHMLLLKLLGSRVSNSSQIFLEIVLIHTDTAIAYGDGTCILIKCDRYASFHSICERGIGKTPKLELIQGI